MESISQSKGVKYDAKSVSKILENAIEQTIGSQTFDYKAVNGWIENIVEKCLSEMKEIYPGFKHIVTCVIMGKNGSGLHSSSSVFWDNYSDDSCTTRWESKTMNVIVTNYALSV
ncbi:dynein light chain Tctex-type 1 [Brachionus plicatilis]|uniref:Dynein light chain Tctex-type 1 n=1 Tax=Brachionus plicatilis TaxID=10195 RepID=A0A3M7R4J0_BRAPC|nr:dynein light chain Tctex-type 1 [Brachionus plicatilis]